MHKWRIWIPKWQCSNYRIRPKDFGFEIETCHILGIGKIFRDRRTTSRFPLELLHEKGMRNCVEETTIKVLCKYLGVTAWYSSERSKTLSDSRFELGGGGRWCDEVITLIKSGLNYTTIADSHWKGIQLLALDRAVYLPDGLHKHFKKRYSTVVCKRCGGFPLKRSATTPILVISKFSGVAKNSKVWLRED